MEKVKLKSETFKLRMSEDDTHLLAKIAQKLDVSKACAVRVAVRAVAQALEGENPPQAGQAEG